MYELTTACTSIVTTSGFTDNIPIHIRTMDWEGDLFRPLII